MAARAQGLLEPMGFLSLREAKPQKHQRSVLGARRVRAWAVNCVGSSHCVLGTEGKDGADLLFCPVELQADYNVKLCS